ncbi:hypothetical protein BGV04_19930, partial [Clostridioides difficile]
HADAVGTGGAGGGEGVVGPLQTQVDRQEAGNHVDDRTGHEERRDAPRPLLEQGSAVVLDIGQAADTGTHGYADTLTIGVGDPQAVRDSGLEITDANRARIGVSMGSGSGGLTHIDNNCRSLSEQAPPRLPPCVVPRPTPTVGRRVASTPLGRWGPPAAPAPA